MNVTQKTVCLYVPIVINSDLSPNHAATMERVNKYLDAMGMGGYFFLLGNYATWPF